jgi:ATP-dependent Clp protease ATP-binding subunit ClpA
MEGALRQAFTPEFLGRLDRVVHFEKLHDDAMEIIARKYLTQLQNRTVSQGIQLVLPEELSGHLGRIGQGRGGARHLRRVVQEQVEGPLAVYLLKSGRKSAKIKAKLENGILQFQG